jgi:hypothetical protein
MSIEDTNNEASREVTAFASSSSRSDMPDRYDDLLDTVTGRIEAGSHRASKAAARELVAAY